nr:trypsin-like peptidase domain-containing protein [Streptomyces sp. DSM 40750]
MGETSALGAPGGSSERPKPLHDPDPYSTPPYGEPGPWAPAPPVQHPATTPAHGTNVQSATPTHGVPASVGAPTNGGATSEGAPTHAGATSAGGPTHAGAPSAAAPAPAEPTSAAPQPSLVPPADGTAVPPTMPRPTTAALYPDTPQPGAAPYPATAPYPEAPQPVATSYAEAAQPAAAPFPEASQPAAGAFPEAAQPAAASYPDASQPPAAPFSEAPQPAAAPYPDAAQPPGASYAYPSQPGPPPFGDSAQGAPPPYADGARPTSAAYADPARPVFADAPQAVPQAPWRNYDPWAGSGSLQQNGAGAADVVRRRRRRVKVLLVGALLIAVVAGGIGGAVGAYLERNGGVGEVELPQASDGVTGRAPDSVAGIAASALPSVVTLHVSGASAQGTGTGFVLDERGHILTNNHVVEPAGTSGDISVTFSGGETAKATIVGRDTGYDLAVVKVSDVSGLKPLPLGNSDEVRVGDPVVAIGAPFDLANTVTSGIISAKERPITAGGESGDVSDVSYVDALQTDAPINPGNSGGPLLDGKARVIGINSAIRSAGSGSESDGGQAGSIGLGFAIPINQGKRVAEELINTGKATHPVIGVTLDMDYSGDGARIGDEGSGGGSAVTAGGPADRAGIRSGDVITEVDGQRVHSGDELIVKVRAHRPGDRLELTLLRGGKEQTVTLTLGSSDGG